MLHFREITASVATILFVAGAQIAAAQETDKVRDDDVVAFCKIQSRSVSGEPTGPKLDLAWQFDAYLQDEVARSDVRIHDPANVLGSRTVDFVSIRGRGTTFFVNSSGEDRVSGLAILIDPKPKAPNDIFDVAVGEMRPTGSRILYSGSCMVTHYAKGGANLMFDALKIRQARSESTAK